MQRHQLCAVQGARSAAAKPSALPTLVPPSALAPRLAGGLVQAVLRLQARCSRAMRSCTELLALDHLWQR